MKSRFSIAVAAVLLGNAAAGAAELPTFEIMGFPIAPHQVAVVGGGAVQEQSPAPTLTFAGMPASPHQIAVLTAHPKPTQAAMADLEKVGFAPP